MKKKLRMVSGNINRALLYLRRVEVLSRKDAVRQQLVADSITALEKFGKTPEGIAFDLRRLPRGVTGAALLQAACDEMKKYLCQ